MPKDLLAGQKAPRDLLQGKSSSENEGTFGKLIKSQRGLTPIGFIPTSKEEALDIPRVAGRQMPGMRGEKINLATKGPIGLGLNIAGIKESKDVIPAPSTRYGKVGETSADLAQLFLGANEVASMLHKPTNTLGRFGQLRKQSKTAQNLSEELLGQMEEARKTAGAFQGGYIDANAEAPIDSDKLKQTISRLPQALQEEVLSNPNIKKVTNNKLETSVDAIGMPIQRSVNSSPDISPNLKNAETIRALIKGKVPSSRWNPKLVLEPEKNAADLAYTELGNIMTEGRPELSESMFNYGKTRQAEKQLEPMIRTRQGFIRTKPVMRMFDKNSEGAASQAVEALAEHNPEILKTVDNIRRFGESTKRKDQLSKMAQRAIFGGEVAGGGVIAGTIAHNAIKKIFG